MEKEERKQALDTGVMVWQVQEIQKLVKAIETRTEVIQHDSSYGYDFLLETSKNRELHKLVFKLGDGLERWRELITDEVEVK